MSSHEVIIDGVRYAPVIEVSPAHVTLAERIAELYWGEGALACNPAEWTNIRVLVSDDEHGDTIEKFVAHLLEPRDDG
jgi:hypothetical protein